MMSFELVQPLSQQMQNQKKVGDNKNCVDHELNRKSSDCFGCFLFHQKGGLIRYLLTCKQHLAVACNNVRGQIILRRERFLLTFHFTLRKNAMADAANKYAENVPGKFYVDDQCIDCDLCRETAPANFKRNDDGGHSYVYKQPETPEEEGLCKEAMEGCPVEAIGNDGT